MAAERGEGEVEEPETKFFPLLEQVVRWGKPSPPRELGMFGRNEAQPGLYIEIPLGNISSIHSAGRNTHGHGLCQELLAQHPPPLDTIPCHFRKSAQKPAVNLCNCYARRRGFAVQRKHAYSVVRNNLFCFRGDSNGVLKLPYAESLVAAARDHFTFLSTSEPTGGPAVEGRLSDLENGLRRTAERPCPKKKSQPCRRPFSDLALGKDGPPECRPVVAQHALQAGVSAATLAEVGRLGHFGPVQPLAGKPPVEELVFSEEENDDGWYCRPSRESSEPDVKGPEKDALREKAAQSKNAESGSAKDTMNYGKSKAGALRSSGVAADKSRAHLSRAQAALDGGLGAQQRSTWHLSDCCDSSRLVGAPIASASLSFINQECLGSGDARTKEAWARAGLVLAQIDQQACDRGNWLLAGELSLEPAPPLHAFQGHVPPETWEVPHSRLMDPRWFELMLSKLKDYADFQEKKIKLNNPSSSSRGRDNPMRKVEPKKPAKGGGEDGKMGKTPAAADVIAPPSQSQEN